MRGGRLYFMALQSCDCVYHVLINDLMTVSLPDPTPPHQSFRMAVMSLAALHRRTDREISRFIAVEWQRGSCAWAMGAFKSGRYNPLCHTRLQPASSRSRQLNFIPVRVIPDYSAAQAASRLQSQS